jgi:glycosyltransferase involved in cell wall biosynthesis
LAYNQEGFIREAVTGAFAQTYSPLEIILSDDCSSDRTFEIMQEMATAYQGPHRLILNRSPRNLGIANHLNHVVQMSHGELLVGSAGDDVSFPERTEQTVAAWQSESPRPLSLFSNAIVMDEKGQGQGALFEAGWRDSHNRQAAPITLRSYVWVIGATHAFSPELFKRFGPIDPSVRQEDYVLAFRARWLGDIRYLPSPLVQYRRHPQNAYDMHSNQLADGSTRKHLDNRIACAKQNLKDLDTARRAGLVKTSAYWHQYFAVSFMCKLECIRVRSEIHHGRISGIMRAFELRVMYAALRILRRVEQLYLNYACSLGRT